MVSIIPKKTGNWPDGDKGFEFASKTTGLIKTVERTSAAYKAGIREGQTVLKIKSGWSDDIFNPLTYLIRDVEGTEREISYLPRGPLSDVPYAQYVNDNQSADGWAKVGPGTNCRD